MEKEKVPNFENNPQEVNSKSSQEIMPIVNTEIVDKEKASHLAETEEKLVVREQQSGKEIDPGVREAVLLLEAKGINVLYAFEGSASSGKGWEYPIIFADMISKEKAADKFLELSELLGKFYADRQIDSDVRLSIFSGADGKMRLLSQGSEKIGLCSDEERIQKFARYRQEISDFSGFLRKEYFGKLPPIESKANPSEISPPQEIERDPQKVEKYNQIRRDVNRIVDGMGLGIDEDVKETVSYLMANGFITNQSCGGHPNEDHGGVAPWVRMGEKEIGNGEYDKAVLLEQFRRMEGLLDQFYQNRDVDDDARLRLMSSKESFTLCVPGDHYAKSFPDGIRSEKTEKYRKEMADFTKYLERIYYQGSAN